MQSFKNQCIALRKQDFSLLEIAKITGRPKTSVYTHIKDIPLSEDKLQRIKKSYGDHIRTYAIGRKGKSEKTFKPFQMWTPKTVLLVAHLVFDGGLYRTTCAYNSRSAALIQRVEKLMCVLYTFEPKRHKNKITGVFRISYHNVALGAYLQKKATELIEVIERLSRSEQREFLRAFFDDEGCMDYRPKRNQRRVRGYQKDVKKLVLVQRLLTNFDIEASIKKPNEVVIKGKKNLQRFQKEINFSPGVRINGKRSNSLWKESLEKRELLDRAIASFRT